MKSNIKKHILLLAAIFMLIHVKAQDTLKLNKYKELPDYVTAEFKQKHPALTFLKERLITPEYNIFDCYKGGAADTVCDALKYLSLVNDLDVSNYNDDSIINLNYIERCLFDNLEKNIIPISASFVEYSELTDSAFEIDAIDFVDNRFKDNSPNGFYPFKKSILFASSPLNQVFKNPEINFSFNNSTFLTNLIIADIDSMYIDFDDGNGYVPLQNENYTINYSGNGIKYIKIKLSYNQKTYYSKSSIIVDVSENRLFDCSVPTDDYDEIRSITSMQLGMPVSGKYGIWYSTCNSAHVIRKPYIIMTGFNPGLGKRLEPGFFTDLVYNFFGQTITIPYGKLNGEWRGTWYETYNGLHNKYFSNGSDIVCGAGADNGNLYLDKIREEGYDVIILMNNIGMDHVENNASLLIQLIEDINVEKVNNGFHFENIVSGYSAGALASRMALAIMESRYKISPALFPHPHTKMWLSFEAENQGNGIPIGFQHFLAFQANPAHLMPVQPQLNADFINHIAASLSTFFNCSPLAREITKYHVLGLFNGSCPERTAMLLRFATIPGNNSNGYPEFCRRVGVSQGSSLGIKVPHAANSEIFNSYLRAGSPDYNATSFPPSSPCAQSYTLKVPHGEKTTIARYWTQNNSSPVFYGKSSFDFGFTYLGMKCWRICKYCDCKCKGPYNVGLNVIYGQKTVSKPTFTTDFDDVPGSTMAAQKQLYETSTYSLYNTSFPLFTASNSHDDNLHRMVPVVSALDLHDPANPGNNFISPVALGLMYNRFSPAGIPVAEFYNSYGFPYIIHPANHYSITPYDAVYAIGDDKGTYTDGSPKPANQFHVEDPLISLGYNLANVEVAPEILYLSNRNLAATQDNYVAEFEAREKIYVGNKTPAGASIYSMDGNQDYLTPDGDFNVDGHSKCILHAPDIIAFTPGTNISVGAQLEAYIQDYNCPDNLRSAVISTGNGNNDINSESENKIETKKELKSDALKLKVYPNPGNGMFIVENKNEEVNSNLIISDLTGKIVFSRIISNNQSDQIDLKQLENGVYLLKVINKNNSEHSKIIINK